MESRQTQREVWRMRDKKTTHVRINKKFAQELRTRFPDVPIGTTLKLGYDTSLLKLDDRLKEKDFKNKMGGFIYGKKGWKDMFK